MNSGYQAIGLAFMWGAEQIILLGFDFKRTGGRSHWHGDHEAKLPNLGHMDEWAHAMVGLAADLRAKCIRVVNASRETALTCFERQPVEDVLLSKAPALVVRGMHGLGDNLHQRSVVRQLMQTMEVWLETPWPCLYHDMVGTRLKLITNGSRLRTQAKNAHREAERFVKRRPPESAEIIDVSYPPALVRERGSVLAAMSAQCGVPVGDFSLPIDQEWTERADALIGKWRPTKPLMIYRPLVDRTEWGGCQARNPDAESYSELFRSIRDRYFVVSVADLIAGKEWIVGEPASADVEFHAGELDIETLAALTARADLVFTAPGFAVVLAQAVGTRVVAVFGGYENSSSFSGGADLAPYLGIDTVRPCNCFSHTHHCEKRIDIADALRRLEDFVK